jgi:hypothetical protein
VNLKCLHNDACFTSQAHSLQKLDRERVASPNGVTVLVKLDKELVSTHK